MVSNRPTAKTATQLIKQEDGRYFLLQMTYKKRRSASLSAHHPKKKKKTAYSPVTDLSSIQNVESKKKAVIAPQTKSSTLVSPGPLRKSSRIASLTTINSDGKIGVEELLQVFLELESLDDKLLRPTLVHGRKKLQALANTGTNIAEVYDVITIKNDNSS